mmetsp:Transcript_21955/g.29234  ORF Transcript_21955/g.29234 Transcript_21955/m.29234 type:complete len:94 (-) Transcript_21955:1200-1481(-)
MIIFYALPPKKVDKTMRFKMDHVSIPKCLILSCVFSSPIRDFVSFSCFNRFKKILKTARTVTTICSYDHTPVITSLAVKFVFRNEFGGERRNW